MARVVTEPCIGCKSGECVEVCPVDCFFDIGNMLVINPEECIDCAACEDVCPVEAIVPDDDANEKWININAETDFDSAKHVTSQEEIEKP